LAATPAPAAGAASQGDWEKIKAAGKMVVGTSADYPPFEYYDSNFKLDGFDIALMQELGKQLGVKVQFRDMAFDGLSDALQLGQIDVAMAAMSVTPDREAIVDFSDVYYVARTPSWRARIRASRKSRPSRMPLISASVCRRPRFTKPGFGITLSRRA